MSLEENFELDSELIEEIANASRECLKSSDRLTASEVYDEIPLLHSGSPKQKRIVAENIADYIRKAHEMCDQACYLKALYTIFKRKYPQSAIFSHVEDITEGIEKIRNNMAKITRNLIEMASQR